MEAKGSPLGKCWENPNCALEAGLEASSSNEFGWHGVRGGEGWRAGMEGKDGGEGMEGKDGGQGWKGSMEVKDGGQG